jgi:Beige/BEACH domain
MSDVKELIPDMYCLPEALLNTNALPLGTLQLPLQQQEQQHQQQSRVAVNNVRLPPWANGSPHTFVRLMLLALESEAVSTALHSWIDLIFGCAQRPATAAMARHNLFYHLTYEGSIDSDELSNSSTSSSSSVSERRQRKQQQRRSKHSKSTPATATAATAADAATGAAREAQIAHFGMTPPQLFESAHPQRKPGETCLSACFKRAGQGLGAEEGGAQLFTAVAGAAVAGAAAAGQTRAGTVQC